MKRFSPLISKYSALAVLPYFFLSWLLLSVILFVQQGSHYSDIFFNANIPKNLIWQLSLALVPNVIAFTCPMAVLIGVVIGLTRMQSDSELIALRAAGVGNVQITFPFLILGVVLSLFTFYINSNGVPFAAKAVKKIALQTALYKLESPIEPGVFNTEINGYTIYVKDGDIEKGTWKNIFIYYEDADNKNTRLITSKEGRIDSKDDNSEIVLENASVNTILTGKTLPKLVSEEIREVRFPIETKRAEFIQKLSKSEESPEELGLADLANFARRKTGKEKTEAQILWQRRIILSVTPLIFAILGVSLVVRFNRGGQGFGVILALLSLLIHYLLTLLGEQLARTNQITVQAAGLIPIAASFAVIGWFFLSKRILTKNTFDVKSLKRRFGNAPKLSEIYKSGFYINLKTRILDFDITINLLKYFLLTFSFLTSVYLIFTAFELWKFAGEINGGFFVLIEYLYYLLPFIYIQLAPSALMIAVLATFVVKSRQNEIVTWTSAGQSIYRLLFPCFALMMFIGIFNWHFQERIVPAANQRQDDLRGFIRARGKLTVKTGKYWIAEDKRIFSFELDENLGKASQKVKNLSIYEFSDDRTELQTIYKTPAAVWEKDKIKFSETAEKTVWKNGKVNVAPAPNLEIGQKVNPFVNFFQKPSHLTAAEIKNLAETSDSETERRNFQVALQKRYTIPFLPFVITLFTAPFALSLSRKGKVITIGYAVGIWLIFIGLTNVFEQFGANDFISPGFAVWSPILLFSILGAYLLSKVKT